MAIQHQIFLHALKGQLTTTRILPTTRRILDLGTGPGYWAVAMAQEHPLIEVVGVDMAVWDLETTEGEDGEGRVTWEIDDLDVWGVDADVDELSAALEQYDPFGDPTYPIDTPSKTRPKDSQPQTPSLAEAGPSFNPYVLEQEAQPGWNFSEPFDLIHMRNLKGTFAYWEDVYAEIYKNLAPGGWLEVADWECVLPEMINSTWEPGETSGAVSNRLPAEGYPLPTIRKLYLSMMQSSFKSGRPLGTYYMHPTYLEDAGFKDVRTTYVNVPVGQWPEDEEQRKVGKMFLVLFVESLEAHLLRLFTKYGDGEKIWTADEVREQIDIAKSEILEWNEGVGRENKAEGWCANFKWIVGRKSKNA